MTREEFEEAKKQSEEIAKLLKEGNLTAEERQKLETLQAQLSGALLSPWLPFGWQTAPAHPLRRESILVDRSCLPAAGNPFWAAGYAAQQPVAADGPLRVPPLNRNVELNR